MVRRVLGLGLGFVTVFVSFNGAGLLLLREFAAFRI